MGYKIYTDHSKFSNGAAKIEEYIGTINSYMMSMNGEINNMYVEKGLFNKYGVCLGEYLLVGVCWFWFS